MALSVHVDDIVGVLEYEDLRDVVVCAASYGGVPATGVRDRVPERIRLLIYVDAVIPRSGQCGLDLLPEWFGDAVRAGVEQHGDAWRVPIPPALIADLFSVGSLSDEVRGAYLARLRDHPAAGFLDRLRLSGAGSEVRRAFVRCTAANFSEQVGDPIAASAARARDEGWSYRELAAPHDPQLFDPIGITTILEELAGEAGLAG